MLRFNYVNGLGDRETGSGWSAKAAGLLEGLPECAEHGYQVRLDARRLCTTGHRQEGLPLYEKALDIGRRLNGPDLIALADTWKALDLIEAGRVEEVFALVDEVSAAAVGGELGCSRPASYFAMRSAATEIQVTSLVPANGQRELRAGAS